MKNIKLEWKNELNPFNSFKVLAWYDRMLKIKQGNFMAPVNIALDVISGTDKCKKCFGFNCNFCMSNFEKNSVTSKIPKNILFKLPKFFKKWGVKSICLTAHNADPLAYNHLDLAKFLKLCNANNIDVGFVSNGYGYSNVMIEAVAKYCRFAGFSINAGNRNVHSKITQTSPEHFDKVISNIKQLSKYIKKNKLKCRIGYKFLITDDSYISIFEGAKLAKQIGVRHFQIRPADLPNIRLKRINIKEVDRQIKKSMKLEVAGVFEVFGVRHKFKNNFKKIVLKCCLASPLGSTWMANGDIVICPDRRWSKDIKDMVLGNFINEDLNTIQKKWVGLEHTKMIEAANKDIKNCIRCTSIMWHKLYESCVLYDEMDITLI